MNTETIREKYERIKIVQLKDNFNYISFFKAVQSCKGAVRFYSPDGDVLNLKSTLSQFIFSAIINRKDFLLSGKIECNNEDDKEILQEFCFFNNS